MGGVGWEYSNFPFLRFIGWLLVCVWHHGKLTPNVALEMVFKSHRLSCSFCTLTKCHEIFLFWFFKSEIFCPALCMEPKYPTCQLKTEVSIHYMKFVLDTDFYHSTFFSLAVAPYKLNTLLPFCLTLAKATFGLHNCSVCTVSDTQTICFSGNLVSTDDPELCRNFLHLHRVGLKLVVLPGDREHHICTDGVCRETWGQASWPSSCRWRDWSPMPIFGALCNV